jgi:ribosomal protein S3AE
MAVRKKFIDVDLPLLEDSISLLGTPETLNGKTVKVDLSRKLRGKSLEVIFRIYNQNGLYGLPKNLNLMKFFIRRMIRKRSSYIEDSFKAKCADLEVEIKPFLISRKRISRAVRANLRRTAKDFLINYIKEKSYLDACREIVSGQLQKEMLPKLKKVYPLSFCEIRVFQATNMNDLKFDYVKKEKVKEEAKEIEVQQKEEETETQETEEKTQETEKKEEEAKEEKKPKKAKKTKKEE